LFENKKIVFFYRRSQEFDSFSLVRAPPPSTPFLPRSLTLSHRSNILRLNTGGIDNRDRTGEGGGQDSPLGDSLRQHSVSFEGDTLSRLSSPRGLLTGSYISPLCVCVFVRVCVCVCVCVYRYLKRYIHRYMCMRQSFQARTDNITLNPITPPPPPAPPPLILCKQ